MLTFDDLCDQISIPDSDGYRCIVNHRHFIDFRHYTTLGEARLFIRPRTRIEMEVYTGEYAFSEQTLQKAKKLVEAWQKAQECLSRLAEQEKNNG